MSKQQVQRNCSTCKKAGRIRAARPGQWTCKECHAEYQLVLDRRKAAAAHQKTFLTPAETATMNLFRKKTAVLPATPETFSSARVVHAMRPVARKARLTTSARRKSSGAAERDRRPWRAAWKPTKVEAAPDPGHPTNIESLKNGPCVCIGANSTFRRVLETRTMKGIGASTGQEFIIHVRRRCECSHCGHRWSEFSKPESKAKQLKLAGVAA